MCPNTVCMTYLVRTRETSARWSFPLCVCWAHVHVIISTDINWVLTDLYLYIKMQTTTHCTVQGATAFYIFRIPSTCFSFTSPVLNKSKALSQTINSHHIVQKRRKQTFAKKKKIIVPHFCISHWKGKWSKERCFCHTLGITFVSWSCTHHNDFW